MPFLYQGDLGELPFPCPDGFSSCPDICFRVADSSFLCHKVPVPLLSLLGLAPWGQIQSRYFLNLLSQAFFCGRSDYFRALLDDHFRESEEPAASGDPPVVTLHDISPDIFTHVLYYVYSDHTEVWHPVGGQWEMEPWAVCLRVVKVLGVLGSWVIPALSCPRIPDSGL